MTFFGRLVRKDVKVEHCVDGLPRGIYIVGKKKNTCRQVECQNDKVKATHENALFPAVSLTGGK